MFFFFFQTKLNELTSFDGAKSAAAITNQAETKHGNCPLPSPLAAQFIFCGFAEKLLDSVPWKIFFFFLINFAVHAPADKNRPQLKTKIVLLLESSAILLFFLTFKRFSSFQCDCMFSLALSLSMFV